MGTNSSNSNPWIQYLEPKPRARLRLFCFPYAGGGASLFRLFGHYLPEEIEVCPVQLPGREARLGEPAFTRVEPLIVALLKALDPYLDLPYAFFGHSMGALISFELAHALRQHPSLGPVRLCVSGHRAPHLAEQRAATFHLPDQQFIEMLQQLQGTPEKVMTHPELRQLFLPLLRADFELCETYQWRPQAPLTCAISAYGGLADGEAPRESILAWKELTSATFNARFFPGGHFYFLREQQALLFALTQDLLRDLS